VKLLSGGNPQITKADGDAPVQAYIAAMPGWKRDVGRRLDATHCSHRPRRVQGREVEHTFLWHQGPGLVPRLPLHHEVRQGGLLPRHGRCGRFPPVESKQKEVRYFHIREDDQFDEAQFAAWVKQPANCLANECELRDVATMNGYSYIRVRWLHNHPDDPVELWSELDSERFEIRKVEVWHDGRVGFASRDRELGRHKARNGTRTIVSRNRCRPGI